VQIAAIKALVDESRPRIHELRDAMKSKREQMHQQLEAGFDETAVRSLAESQSSLMTEMIVMRAMLRSDIQAILTPEQQEKIKFFRQRFSGKQSNY
jgi:Spy/CpxP family protein refolding chaperone